MRSKSLLPSKPLIPPRRLFADAAHYAAMLSYLDGVDRLRAAVTSKEAEQQGWYAAWGLRAFEKAHAYLAESNAGRVRGQTFRPEFAPETIAQQAAFLRQQALALVTHEYLATATSPVFFVFGGSLCTHGA